MERQNATDTKVNALLETSAANTAALDDMKKLLLQVLGGKTWDPKDSSPCASSGAEETP